MGTVEMVEVEFRPLMTCGNVRKCFSSYGDVRTCVEVGFQALMGRAEMWEVGFGLLGHSEMWEVVSVLMGTCGNVGSRFQPYGDVRKCVEVGFQALALKAFPYCHVSGLLWGHGKCVEVGLQTLMGTCGNVGSRFQASLGTVEMCGSGFQALGAECGSRVSGLLWDGGNV